MRGERRRPPQRKISSLGIRSFELALRCRDLKRKGLTGREAGRVLGLGEGQANNCCSALEKLHPTILEAWRLEHPAAAERWLFGIKSKPHGEQLSLWEKRLQSPGSPAVP